MEISKWHNQSLCLVNKHVRRRQVSIFLLLSKYTSSKDGQLVYAFVLQWSKNENDEIVLDVPLNWSMTFVTLLGSNGNALPWHVRNESSGIWTLKLENVLPGRYCKTYCWTISFVSFSFVLLIPFGSFSFIFSSINSMVRIIILVSKIYEVF